MNKNLLIWSTLLALVLLATTFSSTSSQEDVREYDPWVDYDENGKVDIKDIATAAIKFGTTGDPSKNVNVTNWPEYLSGKDDYVFFNYKYGAKPIVYRTGPYAQFTTTSTSPVTILTFSDIDGTLYDSNLSATPVSTRIQCEIWTASIVDPISIFFILNGVTYSYSSATPGAWEWRTLFQMSLNTSKTDNNIIIQFQSDKGIQVRIRSLTFTLFYDYSKQELTTEDFGLSKLYLRTLTLDPESAVRLSRNPNQIITNYATSIITYEFQEGVLFDCIEFLSGNPEITVYGRVEA